ncbi:HtaA domain-containing protein [Streptomyces sp. NPDC101118]|uniref:HtaA domain-containing protein n=1 Tax=Streptomyces sp. NPDC101118 TaxID=3366109 RepID=UPI0037F2330E
MSRTTVARVPVPARRPRRASAAAGGLAAALAAAVVLGATGAATPAAAASGVPLEDYELTWGVKDSWRSYVTGLAAGSFTTAGGARQAARNGAFTFTGGTGSYDPATHALAVALKGSVRAASTLHRFDIVLSDVRFAFDGTNGRLTADVTKNGAAQDDVPLAVVTVNRAMRDMPTTLTKEAADALGSPGYEGAPGSPLTVAPKETAPRPSPTPTAKPTPTTRPTPTTKPTPTAKPTPSAPATTRAPRPTGSAAPGTPAPTPPSSPTGVPAKGKIAGGRLDWGVKQSFRAYVTGPAAAGTITVSGGATQAAGNGGFTFVKGGGRYDTTADTLTAAFRGAVTFKGHRQGGTYGLDLTLGDLKVKLDRGKGVLTADVDSLGKRTDDVPLADLKAPTADLKARNGTLTLTGVKATVTAAGAKAFGDFYPAGTALDPVGLSVALTPGAVPAGTGTAAGTTGGTSGGGPAGTTGGGTGTGGTGGAGTTGGTGGNLATTGASAPATTLAGASALVVGAGAALVLAGRKRRTAAVGA